MKDYKITQEDIMKLLESCYEKCLHGIPNISSSKNGFGGIINLGKTILGVGAFIDGGLDLVETKIIADRVYKWFILRNFFWEVRNNNVQNYRR